MLFVDDTPVIGDDVEASLYRPPTPTRRSRFVNNRSRRRVVAQVEKSTLARRDVPVDRGTKRRRKTKRTDENLARRPDARSNLGQRRRLVEDVPPATRATIDDDDDRDEEGSALDRLRRRALDVVMPESLNDAYEFARFVECASAAMRYVDAIFVLASSESESDRATEDDDERESLPTLGGIELDTISDDLACISRAFATYWLEHADEMLRETDLSIDDACSERLPTATVAFNVVALTDVAIRITSKEEDETGDERAMPTVETTAETFASARDQLVMQTSKPILKYGPTDLVRSLDSLCRSWHRLSIDDSMLRYVKALRLRYGMLIRCATRASAVSVADARWYELPVDTPDGAFRVPKMAFMEEMSHRFRTFALVEWIRSMYEPQWTIDEIRERLRASEMRGAAVSELSTGDSHRLLPSGTAVDGGVGSSSTRTSRRIPTAAATVDRGVDKPPFDSNRGAQAVSDLLAAYAEAVKGAGTIYAAFRTCYFEYLVGPGDDGVFRTREPNMSPSTKNILLNMRGGKFFGEANRTTLVEPHDMLRRSQRVSRIDFRSRYTLSQEVMGLCTFDCLMKGRFNVSWLSRYIVTRATYCAAKEDGKLGPTSLPVLLVTANKYDVLYRGRIMPTESAFEAIAWWLEIVRVETGGTLPISGSRDGSDSLCENFELVADDGDAPTLRCRSRRSEEKSKRRKKCRNDGGDEWNLSVGELRCDDGDVDALAPSTEDEDGENSSDRDGDERMSDANGPSSCRLDDDGSRSRVRPDPMIELENKTKYADVSSVCEVPRNGAASFPVKFDRRRKCVVVDAIDAYSEILAPCDSNARRRRRRSDAADDDESSPAVVAPLPAKRRLILQY